MNFYLQIIKFECKIKKDLQSSITFEVINYLLLNISAKALKGNLAHVKNQTPIKSF